MRRPQETTRVGGQGRLCAVKESGRNPKVPAFLSFRATNRPVHSRDCCKTGAEAATSPDFGDFSGNHGRSPVFLLPRPESLPMPQDAQPIRRKKEVVGGSDRPFGRARSGRRGVHEERDGNRAFAEEVCADERQAQVNSIPLGHVDAQPLYEPRRPEPAAAAQADARGGEGQAPRDVRAQVVTAQRASSKCANRKPMKEGDAA